MGPIIHARCAGLLRLRPASTPIRLECLGDRCAKCCSTMGGGVVVSSDESPQLTRFVRQDHGNGAVLKANRASCVLLVNGHCARYLDRPRGCREYPWYRIDDALYFDSGCPGMMRGADGRPNVQTLSPIDKYLPANSGLRRVLIWLFKHW